VPELRERAASSRGKRGGVSVDGYEAPEWLRRTWDRIAEMRAQNQRRIDSAVSREMVVREEQGYGPFPGGDPRRFTPDPECCAPEEIDAHKAACEAWDRGDGEDRGPSCASMGDGSVWNGTGFGIGTYTTDVQFLVCTFADGSKEEFF
jgi:hypothetical protein